MGNHRLIDNIQDSAVKVMHQVGRGHGGKFGGICCFGVIQVYKVDYLSFFFRNGYWTRGISVGNIPPQKVRWCEFESP